MVSIYKTEKTRGNYIMTELRGLSTDEKPVMFEENVIDNGSTYTEIDTGDVYMYDLVNASWNKISGNGGGGSVEKFDYIIPSGIVLSNLSSGDEITNNDVLSVLNEIKTYVSDELKPVAIGLFYEDGDGNDCFTINNDIRYYSGLEALRFTTNSGNIELAFESNKWKFYIS